MLISSIKKNKKIASRKLLLSFFKKFDYVLLFHYNNYSELLNLKKQIGDQKIINKAFIVKNSVLSSLFESNTELFSIFRGPTYIIFLSSLTQINLSLIKSLFLGVMLNKKYFLLPRVISNLQINNIMDQKKIISKWYFFIISLIKNLFYNFLIYIHFIIKIVQNANNKSVN